jgi:hypothetical protein
MKLVIRDISVAPFFDYAEVTGLPRSPLSGASSLSSPRMVATAGTKDKTHLAPLAKPVRD